MKHHNILRHCIFALAGAAALTGCIEETFPSGAATSEQVAKDPMALQIIVNALTNYTIETKTFGGTDYTDGGMPGWMFAKDVMCEDFPASSTDWDWFHMIANGTGTAWGELPYYYYYTFIDKINDVLKGQSFDNISGEGRAMAGNLYGFRAMCYFELARLFEYQPTGYSQLDNQAATDKIIGLTVPIIEARDYTVAEYVNNPRAPFYKMYRFIWNDLCLAEEMLEGYTRPKVSLMDESVIHGFKARFWLELASRFDRSSDDLAAQLQQEGSDDGYRDLGIRTALECYRNALAEADKVIASGYTPTTEADWFNPKTGFCKPTSAWVWGSYITSTEENPGRWYSFNSWICTEPSWGWTSDEYACFRCISSSLYATIPDADWRKKSWIDPQFAGDGTKVAANYQIVQSTDYASNYPAYANLKFRVPDVSSYTAGLTCCTPFMRVEEMMLLRAEALYHTDGLGAAKSALEEFVNGYRYTGDTRYTCDATNYNGFISALMNQRRIEFWGEGIVFYDYKRLRLQVNRASVANYPENNRLVTLPGYVAPWMNAYISEYAVSTKSSDFKGNPNFSGVVTPPSSNN